MLFRLATPMRSQKRADRFRGIAATAVARYRRHSRIVPPRDMFLLYQLEQFALAQHGVGEIQAREFDLLRMMNAEPIEKPIVERPVILELQRADRMSNSFNGIRLAMGEIIGRIDAPLVAGAMMRRAQARDT